MRYAMLALESRNSIDQRTIGELFFFFCDEAEDIKFSTSMFLLLDLLKKILNENPFISQEVANQIMDAFIDVLPLIWNQKLQLNA